MKLKCDAVWVEPNIANMNEVDYDLWNEWDGHCFMKWMWWKWQGKYLKKITFIDDTHLARLYQYCGYTIPERKHWSK